MSSESPLTLEPKQVFLNMILIPQINLTKNAVFSGNIRISPLIGIIPLRGLIACLHEDSQKTLDKYVQRLIFLERNSKAVYRIELEDIFTQIMIYLNNTYLQEVHIGIVPASSLPGSHPKPSHDAIAEKLSAKL